MKARYYICVGGKWMRLRLRVDGPVLVGQRAKPVFLARCGTKLHALPSAEVSRELSAHAAGAPSLARSGPRLSVLRPVRRRHRCRWRRRANDIAFQLAFSSQQWSRIAETCSVGVGTEGKENVAISNQQYSNLKRDIPSPKTNDVGSSPKKIQRLPQVLTSESLPKPVSRNDALSQVHISLKDTDDNATPVTAAPKTAVKELVISGECVTIFGNWAVSDPMAQLILGEVNEVRFDRDPNYRNLLLYRLQPLVKLERDIKLDTRLLKTSQDEFAAVLGLIPADGLAAAGGSPDLQSRPLRRAVRVRMEDGKDSEKDSPYVIRRPFREYSSLEDAAIVRWVCAHGAERRVNGNTIWKELQSRYKELTGRHRSWHSLRNRYLRHILPSLPRLGIIPDLARRLRSAAAMGELKRKSKDNKNRRNSLLEKHIPAAKLSAHSAGRKYRSRELSSSSDRSSHSRKGKENTKKDTKPKDKNKDEEKSPSYSALTRAFAARHRPSRGTPSPAGAAAPASAQASAPETNQRVTRRLYNPGRTL